MAILDTIKKKVKGAASAVKDAVATGISNVISRTPLSGRDPNETKLTLEDRKRALKAGPVGSTGYELSLSNAYIAKKPSDVVDIGGVKNIGKKAVTKVAGAQLAELGEHLKKLDAQFVNRPTKTNKKALDEARRLYRNSSQAGFAKVPDKAELKMASQNVRTQLIDRFAPIQDLVKNKGVKVDADPYVQARLFAGRFGKIQNRLDELSDVLNPGKDVLEDAKKYGLLERYEELAGRGISKFPGNLTRESIKANKAALEKQLGDRLPQVQDLLAGMRGFSNKVLAEAADAGVISREGFDTIVKNNEKYLPLQRMEYLADQLDNLPRGSKSFSVATQNIVKTIKGSTKEIVDPIEGIIRNVYKTVQLIERNKVALKVADLSALDGFKDMVTKVDGAVPAGFDKFSVLRGGVKEEYAVPKEIADAMKGLTEKNIDIVTQVAGKLGGLLKAGATSLNVGFIPANAIRDFQTATITSKVGFTPIDWLRGFTEAIKKGDDFKAFLESGGSFSGYFEQVKGLSKTAKQLTEGKSLRLAKTIVNPIALMQKVGETIELAPRLGVFKRSLRKGLSQTEAGFNARNATVDFARAGSVMKVANLWVPFLNARTQGVANLLSAIKNKPVRSAAVIGAMVELPVLATYFHNTKFHQDIWDDIAQYEKDNNFIIIYGDERDEEGNPSQVIKIPKGDVGKAFGNPTENFMEYLRGKDYKEVEQVIKEVFSSLSPVDFVRNGEFSGDAVLSGILPPTVKGGVESATNQNLFTGRPIVPRSLEKASPEEQYKETTSPIAVKIGQLLGISPLKLENFIGTQFGGLGRQILNPGEAASQIGGRFSGARGGEGEQQDFDKLDNLTQEDADKKVRNKREAEALLKELKDLSPERRRELIQDKMQRGEVDPDILVKLTEVIEEKAKGLSDFETVFKSQPNTVKAKFLVDKLEELPKEDRKQYFQDLAAKGLLSENLLKEISEEIKNRAQNN